MRSPSSSPPPFLLTNASAMHWLSHEVVATKACLSGGSALKGLSPAFQDMVKGWCAPSMPWKSLKCSVQAR